MKKFYKEVDIHDEEVCKKFLTEHFRYDTMNNWNDMTSYANNIKVTHLDLERDTLMKVFNAMDTREFDWAISDTIRDFNERHNYKYQVGINGRSGGYLVLYRGCKKPSGYKSCCPECGQQSYRPISLKDNRCGRCGSERMDYKTTHMVSAVSFAGIDEGEDVFEGWSLLDLGERALLVQDFDRMTDNLVARCLELAKDYEVVDEEYQVTKTRKVLVPKNKELATV